MSHEIPVAHAKRPTLLPWFAMFITAALSLCVGFTLGCAWTLVSTAFLGGK